LKKALQLPPSSSGLEPANWYWRVVQRFLSGLPTNKVFQLLVTPRRLVPSVRPGLGHNVALRNSSGVSEGIDHSVIQSSVEFPYIVVAG